MLPNRDSNPQPLDPDYAALTTKPPDCQCNHDIAGDFTCDVHITDVCILAKHHAFVGTFFCCSYSETFKEKIKETRRRLGSGAHGVNHLPALEGKPEKQKKKKERRKKTAMRREAT